MYFTRPQFKKFPWKLCFRKTSEVDLKNKLTEIFPNYQIIFNDSGRSAFQLAIQNLGLENSEMIMPAYICDILKPILKEYNIKPIYLDVNLKTFLADFSDIESKITPQTKSILISYTYGSLIEIDKILEIAKKYNLKIIEDCAHLSFGLPRAGSRGDALFFSFSKLFPVINGGILVSKNPINIKLKTYRFKLFNIIKFLRLFPVFAYLSEIFRPKEFSNNNMIKIPRRASMWSLKIVDKYLNDNEQQIQKRIKLAEYFHKKLQEIGFQSAGITYISALVPQNINRDELFYKLKKKNVFCSRIWQNPLYSELPNTAEIAKRIINFPFQNWFTEKDIDGIVETIKNITFENKPV